jgi:hypothetical protein
MQQMRITNVISISLGNKHRIFGDMDFHNHLIDHLVADSIEQKIFRLLGIDSDSPSQIIAHVGILGRFELITNVEADSLITAGSDFADCRVPVEFQLDFGHLNSPRNSARFRTGYRDAPDAIASSGLL